MTTRGGPRRFSGENHHRLAWLLALTPALLAAQSAVAQIHKQAAQDLKKRAAVPFVITRDDETIAGYYTLSQSAVNLGDVPSSAEASFASTTTPAEATCLLDSKLRFNASMSLNLRGLGKASILPKRW